MEETHNHLHVMQAFTTYMYGKGGSQYEVDWNLVLDNSYGPYT